jgi:GAF domain-containing protein
VSRSPADTLEHSSLQRRAARLREALAGISAFLAAGRRPDPLPALRDLASDWLHAEEVEIVVPAGTGPLRSDDPYSLCGPVLIGRRTVGRIEARRGKPFDEDDRALVAALGQIIGGVLEHATLQGQLDQLCEQAQAQANTLERLLAFGRAIGADAAVALGNPTALALQAAAQVPAMLGGERASVLLLPPCASGEPQLLLSNGNAATPERAREVYEHGLAGLVLRERAPLIIDETDTDRRWLGLKLSRNDSRTRCAMTTPLLWNGLALGALTVTTTRSRLFNTAHLNLLELVAGHVALALYTAGVEQGRTALITLTEQLDTALTATSAGDGEALGQARRLVQQLRELVGK